MSKYYDKLLFLVALLILIGGVGYGLTQKTDSRRIQGAIKESELRGESVERIDAPIIRTEQRLWEAPVAQDAPENRWQYGVFTPPKIFLDPQTGQLIPEPPVPPKPKPPFGLQLVSMNHPVYPVQFEAYFESATGLVEDSTVMLYHADRKESSGIQKIGAELSDWGVEIEALEVERVVSQEGLIETVAKVVLKDEKYGRTFRIEPGQTVYLEDKVILSLRLTPSNTEFIWNKVGDSRQNGDVTYTLLQIDFDKKSVTVKKESPDLEEAEEQTLFISTGMTQNRNPSASSNSEKPNPTPSAPEDDLLKSLFN